MEYCCDSFASLCSRDKRSAPNIRIIKYDAKFLQRPLTLFGKVIKVAKETYR